MALADFMRRCEAYFSPEGCIVDQPLQSRLPDGMIRRYMGTDKVVGFGHQLIKALIDPPPKVLYRQQHSLVRASCIRHRRRCFRHPGKRWKRRGRRE
jgi:hypothetical protein